MKIIREISWEKNVVNSKHDLNDEWVHYTFMIKAINVKLGKKKWWWEGKFNKVCKAKKASFIINTLLSQHQF